MTDPFIFSLNKIHDNTHNIFIKDYIYVLLSLLQLSSSFSVEGEFGLETEGDGDGSSSKETSGVGQVNLRGKVKR